MADDLDELIRRSIKTLDDGTPPGYFEGLPSQTLARLEDGNMDSQGTRNRDLNSSTAPVSAPPLMNNDREEDSGLHDIRNLASSTKARLSSRRSTQSPVVTEDDVLASSSAGWKAVALPEPAKMVSLPALAELPSAVEIERTDKAARAAAKVEAKRAVAVTPAEATPVAAAATEAAPANQIGARIAAQQSGGKGKLVALVGVLVAAAAGVGVFVMMQDKDAPATSATSVARPAVVAEAPVLKAAPVAPAPVVEPIPEEPAPVVAAVEPAPAAVVEEKAPAKADKKAHKVEIRDTVNVAKDEPAKPAKVVKEEPKAKGDDNEPSFDALLKEGGISDQKAAVKPKLEKTSLSQPDFKTGISAVSARAQGCFKGTQGTAMVKMSIAPDGSVAKATVTGQFAGTPEGTCVEGAVKSAKFPAWDGGPQSFSYSYLLAE